MLMMVKPTEKGTLRVVRAVRLESRTHSKTRIASSALRTPCSQGKMPPKPHLIKPFLS